MKEIPFWMLPANSLFAFSKPALLIGKVITFVRANEEYAFFSILFCRYTSVEKL